MRNSAYTLSVCKIVLCTLYEPDTCRKEQDINVTGLTSLTKQITVCEQNSEEYDLKVVALETQMERLQNQIRVSLCLFVLCK